MSATALKEPVTIVIEPPRGLGSLELRSIWEHRDLLGYLVRRQFKVRFAQTRAGALWLVIQPLLFLAVYAFAFSRIAKTHTSLPYPLFVLSGLTPWMFISRTLATGAVSLVANSMIIKRAWCPRLLFPLATVLAGVIDLLVAMGLFFVFGGIYGVAPRWQAIFVIPFVLLAFVLTLGLTALLAPYQARYRDIASILPLGIQMWFFLSPVAYTLPKLGAKSRVIELINPLGGILSGFRWALAGTPLDGGLVLTSVIGSVLIAVVGLMVFNRAQYTIADDI